MTLGPAQGCNYGGSAEVRCWRSGTRPCSRKDHNVVCHPEDSGQSHRSQAADQRAAAGLLALLGRPRRIPCRIAAWRLPPQAGSCGTLHVSAPCTG